ncbi:MAG TPA: beta-galactosidase GalA, partial [Verrucomicrobiae bacterium]|nr:beta-galactosidase GalA [Verrucomicrobiae bacterium]
FIVPIVAAFSFSAFAAEDGAPRERLSLDFNWKFHLGNDWGLGEKLDKAGESFGPANKNFNDSSWKPINLPHDWAAELPFDSNANYDHGYKPVGPGFTTNSVGWYRRIFKLTAADRGKRLWLEFDGVYRDCRIFLNGFLLTHHESGYNGFRCDITDVAVCGGTNLLAVRVDASEFEGWFYEGAGIYRHVWLEKTSQLAIAPDGIYVYSRFKNNFPAGAAVVHFETQLLDGQNHSVPAKVTWRIYDPDGKAVAKVNDTTRVIPGSDNKIEQMAKVALPVLWSPENPKLYKLITTVENDGQIVDSQETEFGIRTVCFDTTNGFILNGKPYPIKGTCNHQDHAGVGSALPDALQSFRLAKLKDMGCNAIRTSHNEPTAELLNACDRLGMLVMDENRKLGVDPQNLACLEQQIRRDRNHASVFIWSLANEEHAVQRSPVGARVFGTMQNLVHQLDPTRPCTAAMDGRAEDNRADGFSSVMDVQGFNYIHRGDMDKFHESNPTIPCIGTEESSAYFTRGIYENTKTYRSAYEGNKPDYGTTAEEWRNYYSARPWASGSFVWTGFDYRGEASPFHWPNINSEFGILDVCGFPKDVYYYYQSWWTDKPVLHLMPHWNWPDKEGQEIDVRAFSNCEEVELFLNGQSLGKKSMPKNSHLQWMVKYAPGTLLAKGYTGGKVIAEEKVETAEAPATVRLTPDRTRINADGKDLSIFTVSVTDAQGRMVPAAKNPVHFELSGPGKIIGVGNGDPACHEPDIYVPEFPVHSVSLTNGWRLKEVANARRNQAEFATNCDDASWTAADVQSGDGQLQEHQQAVFRVRFQAAENDLAAESIQLNFERIDDDGYVYVNGRHVGVTHVQQMPAAFEIKSFLHPGENIIAVGVSNDGGPGGISEGVKLEFRDKPVQPHWQRSVFNGLAQVIVQSTQEAGEIKLTATADGLSSANKTIQSTPGVN